MEIRARQDFVQLTFAGASLAVEFEVCLRHVYFPAGMWLVYLVAGVFISLSSPFDICTFMNFASDLARRWRSERAKILFN